VKPEPSIRVVNTAFQRLADGGPPGGWIPMEPSWALYNNLYARLQNLAAEFECELPPIGSCWLYMVWRKPRTSSEGSWEPGGWRSDRSKLMYRLAYGEWPDDVEEIDPKCRNVLHHYCSEARSGCVNPFHLTLLSERQHQRLPNTSWRAAGEPLAGLALITGPTAPRTKETA
jgi:hypothetical protein